MHELPLLTFTLCLQAAVGAVLWAVVFRIKAQDAPLFKRNTLAALSLAAVGIVASLLHLGKPMLALTSMFNLATSWLSREIFFSGAFFGLLLIFWWVERREKAPGVRTALGVITAGVGLIDIYAMARLYMESIMPAWQNANTLISFYATAIVLGGVVFYVTAGEQREKLPRIDLMLWAVVLVQAAFALGYVASLGALTGAGKETAALLAGSQATLILSWLFTLGGVFLLSLSRTGKLAKQMSFLYLAMAVIVVGEIAGRYLFYVSGIPIGLGL
ncbi:dimethyl sulfoxide reductase anchor subunit family protein [Desulfitobacterium chlororespirans]|uniref:Anaerobic dimethyl sulfoxide reductase subunit C (DMSO reductase anchor subunit) n=1 Tax=Desulfitobacterium chlororespirans DSM 11544 TaxID=1121395 RepID=A0A1M7TIQ4_9FIRM|nr:DmsC/YnfH family molybdoenzyme membrane anchor subunit [Desulfitobacterium chlororespirans]SHN70591.1 anaerobic dimethyl sulfoxide reductase subunit C (DMSO reductase anchor subunit) [Desulfitobacterium chlororespirans DSM 11544]